MVRYRVNASLASQRLEDQVLLFDPVRDEVHVLNETATAIWEGVRDGAGPAEIERRLRERWDCTGGVDPGDTVGATLRDLAERGIIEAVPPEF